MSVQEYPHTVFDTTLIEKVGHIGKVLGEFLDLQTTLIQSSLEKNFGVKDADLLNNLLNAFITLEGTKRPLRKDQIMVVGMSDVQLDHCLDQLEKARILRYEDGVFELAHDTLALHISEKRSVDEVAFLEVIKMVKDRHSLYATTNTFLNNNELQLLRTYSNRLRKEKSLSPEEWDYIRKSQRTAKKRRLAIGSIVLVIFLILVGFSIYSLRQRTRAQQSEEAAVAAQLKAEETLKLFEAEQAQNAASQYAEHLAKGRALMGQSEYLLAMQEFETALEFKEDGVEAKELQVQCEQLTGQKSRFEQLITQGDNFYSQGDEFLMNALEKYQQARSLQYDNVLADSKLTTVKGKLEGAFDKFKKNGDTFFRAGGYNYALKNYEQALRIKPNDNFLRTRIAECKKKLTG
ncbi:MAG: hypothetical protein HKN76_20730 [Saprospiraceae bacterium]|nr:hypothetical protein [Saprospiraceae bacterium]